MNTWDAEAACLIGLLHSIGRLKKVINYRKAYGNEKAIRKYIMIKALGLATWEDLLLMHAGFSDTQLQISLNQLENELDLRLERIYQPG